MVSALITILIEIVIGAAIAGIIQYAPFIQAPFKQWALYVVGAVVLVLVILALIPLITGAASTAVAP